MRDELDWNQIQSLMKKHGIRNKSIMAEPPLDGVSSMVQNSTPGVDPSMNWVHDAIKQKPFESREEARRFREFTKNQFHAQVVPRSFKNMSRQMASCKLVSIGDSIHTLMDSAINQSLQENQINAIVCDSGPKTRLSSSGLGIKTDYYIKSFDNIEIKPLIIDEINETKPPKGRTQKHHNLIQSLNTKKRF